MRFVLNAERALIKAASRKAVQKTNAIIYSANTTSLTKHIDAEGLLKKLFWFFFL